MRTMNKIVALSLVLAMALSMMASAASFKDEATINADLIDEINLLVALNVFSADGTGSGNFEPNGTITRSQAAKIIYVLKNKGVDNGATSWTGLNIFSDVEVGSWYEGYVNYCASTGILAGTGDGKYNPNGTLTGVELAKMLLVVIGYKADVEGYTGNNWDANILADAEAAGILVDYELPVRGVITREWSAMMIVNAINATKVKYEDGEAVEMYNSDNEAITYMAQDLGLEKEYGQLTATANIKLDKVANNENGKNKVAELDNGAFKFEYDVNPELLGQEVVVLYKGTSLNNATKIYGVTAHEDVVVLDTTVDAVEYDEDDFASAKEFKLYRDYKKTNYRTTMWGEDNNRAVKLIDNDGDGKWDIAMLDHAVYTVVNYVNPSRNIIRFADDSFNATTKEAYEKVNFVDTVAKDDVVKITMDYSTGKELTNVELVEKVTGAVSKVTSDGVATIDGDQYVLSNLAISGTKVEAEAKAYDYFVDGKFVVYTSAITAKEEEQTNIAYVVKAAITKDEWNEDVNKVDILKNDGTRETLVYKTKSSDKKALAFNTNMENGIYEYVMNSGKVYFRNITSELKIATTELNKGKHFDASADKFFNGTKTYLVNEDTYFFVIDKANSKYAVATAEELKNDMVANAGSQFAASEDGFDYLVWARLDGVVPNAADTDGLAITASTYSTEFEEDGDKVYVLEATKLDGTAITLKDDAAFDASVLGKFVDYKVDGSTGYAEINESKLTGYTRDALTHVDGNAAMLVKGGYMDLADDVKVYYVDAYKSDDVEKIIVSEAEGLVLSDELDTDKFAESVMYKKNSDGEISHIIVEVDGAAIWTSVYDN